MKDDELIFWAALLVAGYYFFVLKKLGRGRASSSPSKRLTTHSNNTVTSGRWGSGYVQAPNVAVGLQPGAQISAAGGTRQAAPTSGTGAGWGSAFIAPLLPLKKVTSTGSIAYQRSSTQIPSYTVIPLTTRGVGGGGSLIHRGSR